MDTEVSLFYRLALTHRYATAAHPLYLEAVEKVATRIGARLIKPYTQTVIRHIGQEITWIDT